MRPWVCGDAALENLASLEINLLYRVNLAVSCTRWRPHRNFGTSPGVKIWVPGWEPLGPGELSEELSIDV